ncbi:MAG: ABC transporter ATP-binding protein [Candidatus Hodarchaeales archaeon]
MSFSCQDIFKIYDPVLSSGIPVLRGLSLSLSPGEIVALQGRSGSGKTTLLNIISGMIKLDAGNLLIDGKDFWSLSFRKRYIYRQKMISIVRQHYSENLFMEKTTKQNIEFPLIFHGWKKQDRKKRINYLLEIANLKHKTNVKIKYLSGGERQKVAICSAIAQKPKILLLDEPTGDLDTNQSFEIISFLKHLNKEEDSLTILLATHDSDLAKLCNKIYLIQDGRIAGYITKEESIMLESTSSNVMTQTGLFKPPHEFEPEKIQNNLEKGQSGNISQWTIILNKDGTLTIPKDIISRFELPTQFIITEVTNDQIVLTRIKELKK